MPLVNVMVNGRAYTLGCDEGEEEHVKQLAAKVDAKVREALGMVGRNAADTKLMLMAALLLADEHDEISRKRGVKAAGDPEGERGPLHLQEDEAQEMAAEMLEAAARRIEDIADRLAAA
ncbi:MAG TPA: cell division protein ZapA [Rhizomicrobium sp.]|jgi:cell division protein ZapA|nr:cell division protein ZapA [Rhizomicrobium sp.]